MTQPTYDQWIAVGIANNYINKKFIGQFAYIIETLLMEHYNDEAKCVSVSSEPKLVIDAVDAFTNDVKRVLPQLSSPILSKLPPLIPSPMQKMNPNAVPFYAQNIIRKPFELMTHEEKKIYFKCPHDGSHGVCLDWLKGNYCDRRCTLRHSIYTGFKSRLCKKWSEKRCPFEDIKCGFAHGLDDIFNRDTMTTKYSARKIVFNKYDDQKELENMENMIWQHFNESNARN